MGFSHQISWQFEKYALEFFGCSGSFSRSRLVDITYDYINKERFFHQRGFRIFIFGFIAYASYSLTVFCDREKEI